MSRGDRYIAGIITSPSKWWLRHLLLQMLIFLISSSVLWEGTVGNEGPGGFTVWLVYFLSLDCLVYLNIYLLAKPLLLRNRIPAYFFSAAGLVIALVAIIGILQGMEGESAAEEVPGVISSVVGVISSVAALVLLFAGTSALVLFRHWLLMSQRRGQLEAANLDAELQMLKNQINPHFLFNMLNNCYLLIRKNRPEATGVIFRLEDLLRYQIGQSTRDWVTLAGEKAFLADFLHLEKIRRDDFSFTIEDTTSGEGMKVAPLLFIPFVENAVKHNTDNGNGSYVYIRFGEWEKGVEFTCINSKPALHERREEVQPGPQCEEKEPKPQYTPDRSGAESVTKAGVVAAKAGVDEWGGEVGVGGIGLRNVRRRLQLLYPGRHVLEIENGEKEYRVTLKLEL